MIDFVHSEFRVLDCDGTPVPQVTLVRKSDKNEFSFLLKNQSDEPQKIRDVILFEGPMPYPPRTGFYAEGFNMLTQSAGTLERIEHFDLTDHGHYKLPRKDGLFSAYNLLFLLPPGEPMLLTGFSSCRRFTNEIRFSPDRFEFLLHLEDRVLRSGETIELEDFFFESGNDRELLLEHFAADIQRRHPALPAPKGKITGWCSWYAYGPDVTDRLIRDNLVAIKKHLPDLRYVQIDDGYQAFMGDWLIPHPNFPNGIQELCRLIQENGFEPAIWVAPFIAEEQSDLFRCHPDWFIMDPESNRPLPSSKSSFGGWRHAPWYMLDGSNPEARKYLTRVFHTMRHEWGCTYFKLDANMWGCMPFGKLKDPGMTHVEAYRAGMKAIAEGAGEDAVILGCNAPMWPSLGTCNAMRISGDIARDWQTIRIMAKECFSRNWQNHRLWINDPDCLVLENLHAETMGPDGIMTGHDISSVSPDEFAYQEAQVLASGGMVLSGDDLLQMSPESFRKIRRILEFFGRTARFSDFDFRYGVSAGARNTLHFFFNPEDKTAEAFLPVFQGKIYDFHSGEEWIHPERYLKLPPHSARILLEEQAAAEEK